ncbi:glycosyltransferase [Janthinobacterium sp. 17J80-10]|uniref:glycosyltransferase n=1 Tax=Janthinobacterium sp. 17J80-10 TaxID=2497863 RepID=UPI001005A2F4|nr:glycosyltransferase [Janthinobacterium sp. 17J80-10]QAU33632.1 colanic acid biosynthesis glycosyltransferase WcaL [Janthinobacterium sp. 17J80-10]
MNKEITVAHSVSSWLPQTQTWLFNQIRYLPKEIVNHVICEFTENLDQFLIPNIHCLSNEAPFRYYWDKILIKARIRHHLGYLALKSRQHNINILHSHFGYSGWQNLNVARTNSIHHVVTFYGLDVNKLPVLFPQWRKRYATLFREVDRVLCEGAFMANSIINLGCPAEKVAVHHLGIEVDLISFRPRVWNPGSPLRVLIAASFREKKGISYAIEALARLKGQIPLEVTIIGDAGRDSAEQEEKRKILKTIDKHGLNSCIRMMGYQPHSVLFSEAYNHHIFLSPSITALDGDTEGGAPVTLGEMAATGMPIVSSFHCDIPDVIKHGITGRLANERDVDELVSQLSWYIEHPEKWHSLLVAGRQHMESEYNSITQGNRLGAIYEELQK